MSMLNNYVKKQSLYAIVLAVIGLWLLQLVFSYLNELDSLTDTYTMLDALQYILYKSPYFLEQFIPTGALMGAVVGLGLLANNSELVVMRASGVSNFKIVSWVMQPALLFVVLSLSLNQFVLPHTNQLAEMVEDEIDISTVSANPETLRIEDFRITHPIYQQDLEDITPQNHALENKKELTIAGKEVFYIEEVNADGTMTNIKRWRIDNAGNIVSSLFAAKGFYDKKAVQRDKKYENNWSLVDAHLLSINRDLSSQASNIDTVVVKIPITPNMVSLITKDPEDMSLTELWTHKDFMQTQNKRSFSHELQFWKKLLSPFAILSLVIVACSFVFGSLRSQSLGSRVVMALIFGLFFKYMQDLSGFVVLATKFSPIVMVALPIVACALLGIKLLNRQT